ncbi:ROK family protein [Microbacterium sp. zg.Y909]|uniref:ROK family protein n=1 Tax=Microbacterium sp. zg.Y909 TaxID=2969413 RepID=UPI00214A9A42|nr:ROK family protein [Microbacterium sp. zg.Y909]MCR2824963.1 ROK family protein [Microbacterium sp. zg.Y909]
MSELIVGIDIGGTKIAGALVDEDGALRSKVVRFATPARSGAEAIVSAVSAVCCTVTARISAAAIGIGSAGTFDRNGRVVSATNVIPGWAGTPLQQLVKANTGIPTVVLNDVHAAALGEAAFGAGREHPRSLVVAIGTGIGGALVIDGKVDIGTHGLGGSVGHLPLRRSEGRICSCGGLDHVEAWASGPALERRYDPAGVTGLREIAARARHGDKPACKVFAEGASALGEGLAAAATMFDPDAIILGGGVAALEDLIVAPTRAAFQPELPPLRTIPIIPAELGSEAAIVGAAHAARLSHG